MADLKEMAKGAFDASKAALQPSVDAVKNVANQAQQAVAAAGEKVQGATSYLGEQAETATDALSGGLKSAARTIRANAPQDGPIGQAAGNFAQSFSNTAGYLDREGLAGISKDLTSLIQNNPIPALVIGFGLGFLIARGTDSRS